MITGISAAMLLLGVLLLGGGAWLVILGGSGYYLLAAFGLLASGVLLARRRMAALAVYALLLVATLAWSLWEAGLDWWALVPRCALFVVLGAWLLTPRVIRALGAARARTRQGAVGALGGALSVSLIVAALALIGDPHDHEGRLPAPADDHAPAGQDSVAPGEWHAYGGSARGQRYSPLAEITAANVARLERRWIYHSGDVRDDSSPAAYEATPLMVDGTLYFCTPHGDAIALDADDGRQRWRFSPRVDPELSRQHAACRGVAYHERAPRAGGSNAFCARRILLTTPDARLVALDAASGRHCPDFGVAGEVDLGANMPIEPPGYFTSTSPPAVAAGLVIVGGVISDTKSAKPSGTVRAYDVDSGALVWNWDPDNPTATAPLAADQHYRPNSPHMWSVASVDERLGMVYLPMGNQQPPEWGGNRDAQTERFSTSIVALDLATGRVRWVFQAVHHDLWDYDMPAQPSLIDLDLPRGRVPALVAPTKQGDIYVLDRRSGEPVLPVDTVEVPTDAVPGDTASPVQPVSALSFAPPPLRERDMWGATPLDQLMCRIRFRTLDYEGRYTPPSPRGTLVYPGNFGVFNWGGIAVDPIRQVAFVTPAYLAFVSRLVPKDEPSSDAAAHAATAHGDSDEAPFSAETEPFLSPFGLPCQAPPWGYVAGVELTRGEIAWRHRNGTVRDLSPLPLPFAMGVPSLGGPLITAGGVAFLSGTLDNYVRAYDVTSGRTLWRDRLPAGGQATPMSYRDSNGRQLVVVVAGGHGELGTDAGDAVIAYGLPDD